MSAGASYVALLCHSAPISRDKAVTKGKPKASRSSKLLLPVFSAWGHLKPQSCVTPWGKWVRLLWPGLTWPSSPVTRLTAARGWNLLPGPVLEAHAWEGAQSGVYTRPPAGQQQGQDSLRPTSLWHHSTAFNFHSQSWNHGKNDSDVCLDYFTVLQRNFRQIIYFLSFMKSTKRSSHFIVPWTDRKCQRT